LIVERLIIVQLAIYRTRTDDILQARTDGITHTHGDCQLTTTPDADDFDPTTLLHARFQELAQASAIDLSLLLCRICGTAHIYVTLNSLAWSSAGCRRPRRL